MLRSYSFRLEEDIIKEYERVASENGLDRSEFIRDVLQAVFANKFIVGDYKLTGKYNKEIDNFNKKVEKYKCIDYNNSLFKAHKIVARLDTSKGIKVIVEGIVHDQVAFNITLPIKELSNIKIVKDEGTRRMNLG